jgi:hypothetical protein
MTTHPRRLILPFVLSSLSLSLLAGCGGGTAEVPAKKSGPARVEDPLESAKQMLSGSPDRAACGTALQQVNAHLAAHPERRPPALTDEQRKLLRERLALDAAEMTEVESPTYTLLDSSHLDFCILLRDAMRSLALEGLSPPEQAAAGFAWAMRQVAPLQRDEVFAPEFILRRGTGTDRERAYVFLAVLRQLGIPGCFVAQPDSPEPWACGALVAVDGGKEKQVLLFDHRLGLPLPGPKGKADGPLARAFRRALPVAGPEDGQQIITLAELRKQPELLKPLTADDKHRYDVGAEQVKESKVQLALPLSALSPRMRALEDDLLPRRLGVRVAVDPADLVAQFGAAAGVEGGADAVRGREGSAGVLRRFLSPAEGGTDKDGHALARLALVPNKAMPAPLLKLEGDPGLRIRLYMAQQFIGFQLEPRMPRDLVLRGEFKEVASQLTSLLEVLKIQKAKLQSDPDAITEFERWKEELFQAFGDAGRAQDAAGKGGSQEAADAALARREQVWKNGNKVLSLLVDGGTAEPRGAQATYQLALCMHEQAERLQARADQLRRAGQGEASGEANSAAEAATSAWKDAAGWWKTYIQDYPLTVYSMEAGLHARLLHARAQDALGNRDQARALLEDAPPQASERQQLASLYLARRLKAP